LTRTFSLTYDYLCPFAAGANQAVLAAMEAGADWQVRFVPFSLAATKVGEDERPVWERPGGAAGTSGVAAHQWALAVREFEPASFRDFHTNVFAARHREGRDINDQTVLETVATASGLDPAAVAPFVDSGSAAEILGIEHREAVARWQVFGVPTFIRGDQAVFVRLMDYTRKDVERVLDMLEWSNLNEFKRTSIPR
jgi:hypothetical protein